MRKMTKEEILYLIYFFIFIIYNQQIYCQDSEDLPKYEIHIYFEQTGEQAMFCNDNIEIFDTENINFYKIDENGNKININSFITMMDTSKGSCEFPIIYDVASIEEKIIIEISGQPKKLKQLFANSDISRIERFDYPFPEDESNFNGMFYYSTKLKYVDLSNFSFRNAIDLSHMFYCCSNLEQIIFPTDGNSNKIENLSDMFAFSSKITTIDLSTFNFKNTKDMGYMFNGCYDLNEIIFPKNDKAEKLEILSDMFANCKKLRSIDLSYFSFKKVTNSAYMFNGCPELVSIIFPNEEKANSLQFCKYMFCGCTKLKSIDLSILSFVNVVDASSMFNGCSNLETLILPQNEIAMNIEDYNHMFQGCTKLVEIDLSNIDFSNAKNLKGLFHSCTSLRNVELIASSKTENLEDCSDMFLYCESLISIDLSNFSFKKVRKLSAMFLFCNNLETVILPQNEISTSVEDISYMFAICFKLKNLDMSGISFVNLRDMSYSLSNCISLENLILPSDTEFNYIENIAYAFSNCYKLTTINLYYFNLENILDLSYLFFSCSNLKNITWPRKKINKVQILDHIFYNCTSLETIDLSDSINLSSVINLDFAFSNCINLKNFIISKSEQITNIVTMNNTFSHNLALTSLDLSQIYISESVNLNECFYNCPSLKEINIWNLKTSQSILTYNFLGDSSSLEGGLYHSHDEQNIGVSLTNKKGSKYIGFHKCGPCINTNENEYCTMNTNGENLDFYYVDYESNLPISERQCYWSKNYENVGGFTFLNNTIKGEISYYIDYCDHFCNECSENRKGCTQCNNHLYPIDTEYNDYLNGIQTYFFCYNVNNLKNYYLNIVTEQFSKCAEKCSECRDGVDICINCNKEKGYYPVEGIDNECWKDRPENYILEKDIFKKCNDRCKNCTVQSKLIEHHYCEACAEGYYPYETDLLNFKEGKEKKFNCYTVEEVKSENKNYYLKDSVFKRCDDSCSECEIESNNCLKCQMNYYYIDGFLNGTCFKSPLEGYCPSKDINGNIVYMNCYKKCKLCHRISQSFLYQQCSECDEENYTLAKKSLNQSYCIPKINYDIHFINQGPKWFIKPFDGMKDFDNKEGLHIDLQRLLQSDKYSELDYVILTESEECPPEIPYIIFETRQCVSSCNSSNLLEYGIFISKDYKLYQYQNICYTECPYGSVNDNITLTCKEKYEYINNFSLTQESYQKNRNQFILSYLGDEYARETVEYIRGSYFSYYHHKVEKNYENIEKMKESKMPIYYFDECINKLKFANNLNESEEIFIEITENNTYTNMNSTSFMFFTSNGTQLNLGPCLNTKMIALKSVNTFDKNSIDELKSLGGVISDVNFLDECQPISINGSDIPISDREKLYNKSRKLCDNGCSFIDFDKEYSYSICQCKILEEKEKGNGISEEIIDDIKKSGLAQGIALIFEDGNWAYFKCPLFNKKYKVYKIFIMYLGILFFIIFIMITILFIKKDYKKMKESLYLDMKRYSNKKDDDILNDVTNTDEDNNFECDEIIQEFESAKRKNISFLETLKWYIKQKIIIFIFSVKDYKYNSKFLNYLKLFIFVENYYFFCGFLFTSKYISSIKNINNSFELVFVVEKRRIILIIIICSIVNLIIFYFFNWQDKVKKIMSNEKRDEDYHQELNKTMNNSLIKLIIGFSLVFVLSLTYIYFISIFGAINSNSQWAYMVYLIISFVLYFILYLILILIIVSLRWLSIKCNFEIFFTISQYLEII